MRWLCREHADEVPQAVPDQRRSVVRLVAPTCGFGGRGAPCGGMSTHVAIVGTKDHGLDLVSVCARHVEEFYAAGR